MDIRTRVLATRLAGRIDENKKYSEYLSLADASHYKRQKGTEKKGGK